MKNTRVIVELFACKISEKNDVFHRHVAFAFQDGLRRVRLVAIVNSQSL